MHALTCEILNAGDTAYAMIPTYYKPNKFIAAKVYIEYAWHGTDCIFYHCMIRELLDDLQTLLDVMPTALVRAIDKTKHQPVLTRIAMPALSLSKSSIQNSILAWHANFLFDIPAPFVVRTKEAFANLQIDICNYFKSLC